MPLTDDELGLALSHFTYRTCKKRHLLIREGEGVREPCSVVMGLLKLVYTNEVAKSHIVSFALEYWWESDFQAYYNQTPATLSLECLEDTAIWCLSLDNYRRLCAQPPPA